MRLNDWFNRYVRSFKNGDRELLRNIVLKESHTRRVCAETVRIGKKLGLEPNGLHEENLLGTARQHLVDRLPGSAWRPRPRAGLSGCAR